MRIDWLGILPLGLIELVLLGELRPFVPERPGGDVDVAVLIEVAEGRAFGEKLVADLDLLPGVKFLVSKRGRRGEEHRERCDDDGF